MSNPAITNNDTSELVSFAPATQQDILTFTTAQTHAQGLILARKLVEDTVTASAITGTGNGTLTAAALGSGGAAKVGAYELKCLEAITNSGRFKLTDPDGKILTSQIVVPVSGAIAYENFGLKFTLTDGSTDFAQNDLFTLTTTVDGNLAPYDDSALDGLDIPVAVMPFARTEATGANYPQGVIVEGELDSTIMTSANGTMGPALLDELLSIGIIVRPRVVNDALDNQ